MQDRYAFDVGDFGKIGLLRYLAASTNLPLGVLWWKTDLGSEGHDGKHVGYLKNPKYRHCDPWLWEMMGRLIEQGRLITALERLLPPGTRFHRVPVPGPDERRAWLRDGLVAVRRTNGPPGLLFCDPDNGVAFRPSCTSLRHIGVAEVKSLWEAGNSMVLYHHLNRRAEHVAQVAQCLRAFRADLRGLEAAWGAHYHRGSSRVFFVLSQPDHRQALERAVNGLVTTPWVTGRHFSVHSLTAASTTLG